MKIRIQTLLSILSVIVAVLTVLRHTPGVVDAAPDLAWKVLAWAALAPTVLAVRELRRTGSAPAGEKTMGAVLILFCLGDVFPGGFRSLVAAVDDRAAGADDGCGRADPPTWRHPGGAGSACVAVMQRQAAGSS